MSILLNKRKLNYFVLLVLSLGQLSAQRSLEKKLNNFNEILAPEKIYVHTDRTYYQPGQTIWFSIYLLTQELNCSDRSTFIRVELINPAGSVQQDLLLEYNKEMGNIAGDFLIDKKTNGGLYKLRVYSNWMEQTKQIYFEKEINIQAIVYSNVLMKLDFARESYGAGSLVQADLTVLNLENEALRSKKLSYTISLKGKPLLTNNVMTNEEGKVLVQFKLPKTLQTSDGLLTVKVKHNDIVESISRRVPIVLNKIDLQFLPEGGNYVLGLPQKIAFLAQDEFGKPADISGLILLGEDTIKHFKSYHQGMGSFELTPKNFADNYIIKITEPANNEQSFSLKMEEKSGSIGLQLRGKNRDSLIVNIYVLSTQEIALMVQMQGKIYHKNSFKAIKGNNELIIPISKMPIGIAQLTIFDKGLMPQAERLVFVNKHQQLKVDIKTNKALYAPNEKVMVDLTIKNQDLKPVEGCFSLSVVDEKNLTLADDKQGNILAQLLLTEELKGKIYEPNFYFDPKELQADTALDYVLLTHGWRRFEWKSLLNETKKDWEKQIHELADKCFIKGLATVNGLPLRNRIILLEKNSYNIYAYNKKSATAWTTTDKHGHFSFEETELTFPNYLSTNYRGAWATADVPTSQTGIYKARIIESAERSPSGNESFDDHYYVNDYQNYKTKKIKKVDSYDFLEDEYSKHQIISMPNANNGMVYVKVSSMMDNERLSFAQAVLFQGETLVHGTTTGIDGIGQLTSRVEAGNYRLRVSYMGYRTYETDVFLDGEEAIEIDVELGETMLLLDSLVDGYGYKGVVTVTANQFYKVGSSAGASMNGQFSRNSMSMSRVQKMKTKAFNNAEQAIIRRLYKPSVKKRNQSLASYSYGPSNRYTFLDENNDWKAQAEVRFDLQQIKARTYYKARKFINYKRYKGATKRNFNETAYWEPQIKTDKEGKASISFYNSDALSSFKVVLEGIGQGSVGHEEKVFCNQSPIAIIAKVPKLVSFGDTVIIPIVLRNNTERVLNGKFEIYLKQKYHLIKAMDLSMQPNSSKTEYAQFVVKEGLEVDNQLVCAFNAKKDKERIEHPIRIISKGFPKEYTITSNQMTVKDTLFLGKAVKGTLVTKFYVELNPLNGLSRTIAGILRYPSGCFEQVSAKNYPNILALQYMNAVGISNLEQRKKIKNYLKLGYEKLVAYETKVGGFEWYGDTPPHLGLTAHGLLQFHEMQSIYDGVDLRMMRRVKNWILNTRDGKGGFVQKGGKYGFSNKNEAITNAYVLYALSHLKESSVKKELRVATQEAEQSKDLYRVGLMILAHLNYDNKKTAKRLWKIFEEKLIVTTLRKATAQSSITNSQGKGLNIEVVAMGIVAMMRLKVYKNPLLEASIKYIYSCRSGSVFGNTQSTIWALKAIIEYQKKYPPKIVKGSFLVKINGKTVEKIAYSNEQNKKINLADLTPHFITGQNIVEITCSAQKGKIPAYSFDLNWVELLPENDTTCLISIETKIAKKKVQIGETVRLTANLKNKSNEAQASTVAVIGIPAGLSLQAWQLKELQEEKKVDYIELMEDYVVLHYRDMEPKEEHCIHLDLKTEFLGYYQAPTSVAYLYYNNEYKYWAVGANVHIQKE